MNVRKTCQKFEQFMTIAPTTTWCKQITKI